MYGSKLTNLVAMASQLKGVAFSLFWNVQRNLKCCILDTHNLYVLSLVRGAHSTSSPPPSSYVHDIDLCSNKTNLFPQNWANCGVCSTRVAAHTYNKFTSLYPMNFVGLLQLFLLDTESRISWFNPLPTNDTYNMCHELP